MTGSTWTAPRRAAFAASFALVALLGATAAIAQDATLKDLPNAKDSPFISRFAGSALVGYEERPFDQAQFPLTNEVADKRFVKAQTFEGKGRASPISPRSARRVSKCNATSRRRSRRPAS